jgi:hypothetical protein
VGAGLVLGLASFAAACGSAFSAGPGSDAGSEGSAADGPDLEGGSEADGSDAGDSIAASGKIVYVSQASGDDSADGRDPKHPKKTIVSAVTEAATLGAGAEVHVCNGTYAEKQLSLTSDMRLMGSYDCTTWTRSAGFGFPVFDGKNPTTITNGQITSQHATLTVIGSGVTHATTIDGFAIQGAPMYTEVTYGVDVQGSASPVVTNDVIAGGGGSTATGPNGSVGVRIGGSSSAELAFCAVGGGTGTGAIGSLGVLLASTGLPSAHDDVVTGGTGSTNGMTPSTAAVGVEIGSSLDSTRPLATVLVTGSDKGGASGTTVGVLVAGSGVNAGVLGCEIQGGTGTGSGATSIGVEVATTGTVVLDADRIFGGSRSAMPSQTFGVAVVGAGGFTLQNSEVHAGTVPAALNSYAVGVALTAVNAPQLLFDTIYTGSSAGTDVVINTGVTGTRISDDILFGSDSALSSTGVSSAACGMAPMANLDHTAFVNLTTMYTCGSPPASVDSVGALSTALGGSVASGDVEVENSTLCTGAAWCVTDNSCPSTLVTPCMTSLLGTTWSATDDGVAGMFFAKAADGGTAAGGWALEPSSKCALTRGAITISGITTDMFGTARSGSPTMGAVEYTSTTPCAL